MSIKVLDEQFDQVIQSKFITAIANYEYALDYLVPLINRLEQQRYTLRSSFYEKLERDISKGCIMPPLTLAINSEYSGNDIETFINKHIKEAFVLDGIQRLNTLKRIGKQKVDLQRPIFLNILICQSMDKLLYRMITLNNGQKPMSARHQVEILANNIYSFDDLDINIQTEKQQRIKRINNSFKKEDIIKAYLAFISNSINIDNQKIIESKLDELITDQIIESDLTDRIIEFSDIIDIVNKFIQDSNAKKWFLVSNNFIGFAAGITKAYSILKDEEIQDFVDSIDNLEQVLSYIDISKVKLGLVRRKAAKFFIENYDICRNYSINKLTDAISQEI